MAEIDVTDKAQRDEYIERSQSGDPIKDWYDDIDLQLSLEAAFRYIDELDNIELPSLEDELG